jgi:uncharacterized membrane protein
MATPSKQQGQVAAQNATASAVRSAFPQQPPIGSVQIGQVQAQSQLYSGPVPHPDILQKFDTLVPGTAQRMIQLAEDESIHRRRMESAALDANIDAQRKQLDIAASQNKAVFRSDLFGQVFGLVVALACIAAAVYLAMIGNNVAAGILAAMPTAAVIRAFFVRRIPAAQNAKNQ